ncbi:MAG TPA: hypothetical protein PLB55_03645 [Prosthecobacter sp.]|nr:hypothetical protein [Prosthecobacter sp.]
MSGSGDPDIHPTTHMPATLLNWDDHRATTTQRLQALRDFFTAVRASLDSHERRVKSELDQAFAEADPILDALTDEPINIAHQVLYHYSSHFRSYYHEIPRLLHNSSIIQLYTLFEERGRALCNEMKRRDSTILLKVTDLLDRGDFESIQLFITKLCGVDFPYWSDLHLLRRVRNRLVHHNGYVPDETEHKKLEAQIASSPGIRIDADRYILILPDYVDYAIGRVSEFFESVFQARGFGNAASFTSSPLFDHGAILMDQLNERTVVTLTSELTPRV